MTGPLEPPAFQQAPVYPARHDRQYLITGVYLKDAAVLTRVKGGLLPDAETRRAPSSVAGMQVTIGPFRAVVPNTQSADAGDYLVTNLASFNVTLGASSPTLNRIDLIGVRVRDAQYSGADNDTDIIVVAGTPAAGAAAEPTVPANFLRLWRAEVNAGVTSPTMVDQRRSTVPVGGIYVPYTHEFTDAGSWPGEMRLRPSAGANPPFFQYWDGAAWVSYSPKPKVEVFTASGNYVKPEGAKYARIRVQGGGGGGGGTSTTGAGEGSAAGGGGSGAYAEAIMDASALASSVAVTVGAAGTGGASGAGTGGSGGQSSFAGHLVCPGGLGGSGSSATATNGVLEGGDGAPVATGTATNAIKSGGSQGGHGIRLVSLNRGGQGAPSPLGGGGSVDANGPGTAGTGYGSGGAGSSKNASQTGGAGSAGAPGAVIVETYF